MARDLVDRLPAPVRRRWDGFAVAAGGAATFDPRQAESLPEPARRWLRHAIAPGTPLRRGLVARQHGQIRLGRWFPFRSRQALAAREGYVWVAASRIFGLPVFGYDALAAGSGELTHRLLGLVPVVSGSGPDIARSAAGRLTSELVWTPGALLDPDIRWKQLDENAVLALVPRLANGEVDEVDELTLTVDDSGSLQCVLVQRWAAVGKEPFGWHSFGAVMHAERSVGGYTVPVRFTAGYDDWLADPDERAFLRMTVDDLTFR